jgi:hypothetical protein
MSDHADFNEEARRVLREAMASSARLIAESRQIEAESRARLLDSLIIMFRSDALVCASKNRTARPEAGRDAEMIGGSLQTGATL